MAPKKKSSSKKSAKRKSAKTARKIVRKSVTAKKTSEPSVKSSEVCCGSGCELAEEHRVLSHLMYICFLISAGLAAYFTFGMIFYAKSLSGDPVLSFFPVKALVMLGWAYFFKMFGHRMHPPHN